MGSRMVRAAGRAALGVVTVEVFVVFSQDRVLLAFLSGGWPFGGWPGSSFSSVGPSLWRLAFSKFLGFSGYELPARGLAFP